MLVAHDRMPHFSVTSTDGRLVSYRDIWQRKHLLLVMLRDAASPGAGAYIDHLGRALEDLASTDIAAVVTTEAVDGLPLPGVAIADRWGEIVMVAEAAGVENLPDPAALVEWLRYVEHQCPECEGEAR
jgi:hypothetical protein